MYFLLLQLPAYRRFCHSKANHQLQACQLSFRSSSCKTRKRAFFTLLRISHQPHQRLSSATFTDLNKNAIITPLLKKPSLDKEILSNYRPISNLSFLSKLTEKAALHQICPYIESNNLLPSYQSAYRKFYSTETAVIKMVNDILWNMENQEVTSLIGIDLSAAFDTVDHDTLLSVLNRSFGITQNALTWVESYLSISMVNP